MLDINSYIKKYSTFEESKTHIYKTGPCPTYTKYHGILRKKLVNSGHQK